MQSGVLHRSRKESPQRASRPTAEPSEDHLGPLGRAALAMTKSGRCGKRDAAPKAEQFLDKAGIVGALRRPRSSRSMRCITAAKKKIEAALARHWKEETLPQISSLLSRFPFNQASGA